MREIASALGKAKYVSPDFLTSDMVRRESGRYGRSRVCPKKVQLRYKAAGADKMRQRLTAHTVPTQREGERTLNLHRHWGDRTTMKPVSVSLVVDASVPS